MKIEVGEYVRTNTGKIDKVINNNYYMPQYIECEKDIVYKENISKHSKNLIDLIEVGDYVNGHKIIMDLKQSRKHYDTIDCFVTAKGYTFEENEIETILTKKQYKANCYRVERKE